MSAGKYDHCWNWVGSPWKTESAWMGWLRGALRSRWARHPVKIAKINAERFKIPNPSQVSAKRFPLVWGAKCACCGGVFPLSGGKKEGNRTTIQVDHIQAAGSLRTVEDLGEFAKRLYCVGLDELRLVCTVCNKDLAYADKHGISEQEAKITRAAIQIVKDKKDVEWLRMEGIEPAKSQAQRRKQIIERMSHNA